MASTGSRTHASALGGGCGSRLARSQSNHGATLAVLFGFAVFVLVADMAIFGRGRFGLSFTDILNGGWQVCDGRMEFFICACITAFLLVQHCSRRGYSVSRSRGAVSAKKADAHRACGGGAAAPRGLSPSVASATAFTWQSAAATKCLEAIEDAACEGNTERAGELLLRFERAGGKLDHRHYNSVIRAHAKRGDPAMAERCLKRMVARGVPRTLGSYNMLLDAYAKTENADACETWLQNLLDDGIEANITSYASAIYAYARRGDVGAAEMWLQRMVAAGIEPDSTAYNVLVLAHAVRGNVSGAEALLKEMQSRGLEPSVCTYTAVINACAKSGDMSAAEHWFQQMVDAGVRPSVTTFGAMIDACAKAGDVAHAEQWHDRMVQHGIAPNAHTCSAMINACAKARSHDKAEAAERWLTFYEEGGIEIDVVVYSSVIDACAKVGDGERAMRIFRRMQARGLKPHVLAFSALARPFAYRGDWIKVEAIAQEMAAAGIKRNTYFVYTQLVAYGTAQPKQFRRLEQCFRSAIAEGIEVNDHIASALFRGAGRQRCDALLRELCPGRELPTKSRPAQGGNLAAGLGA